MSENMSENQDTELTLSTGKLLFIFFALVMLCAVFFSLGYAVGRGNRESAPPITEASTTTTLSPNSSKPTAGVNAPQSATTACPDGAKNCIPVQPTNDKEASSADELSFTKDKPADKNAAPANPIAGAPPSTAGAIAATLSNGNKADDKSPTTGSKPPETVLPASGIMVQVAAVSKQSDADALVNALRKKQYPVIVVNNVPGDTLFHVQVGPFSQQKDAEAMQKKLQADGYNAMIRK